MSKIRYGCIINANETLKWAIKVITLEIPYMLCYSYQGIILHAIIVA